MQDQDKPRTRLIAELQNLRRRLAAARCIEQQLQVLLRHMDAAVVIHDKDSRILAANPQAQGLFGLTESQMVRQRADEVPWNLLHPDGEAWPLDKHPVHRVLKQQRPLTNLMAGVYRPEQADIRWVVINGHPITNDRGEVDQVITSYVDITEGKWAEEALRKSELLYRSIVEQACEGIALFDLVTKQLLEANPAYQSMLGYSAGEMRQLTLYDIAARPPREIDDLIGQIEREKVLPIREGKHRRKDGTLVDVEISVSRIAINRTDVLLAVVHDISERNRLQTQLNEAKKMETIGTLAGGIAHDFNNILTPILGYTEMALQHVPPGDALREDLKQVMHSTLQARDLVRQILLFSRESRSEQRPVSLPKIVAEAVELLRSAVPDTITVTQRIDPRCGSVEGDAAQIRQVILNLAANAWHAMEAEGGTLTVELSRKSIDPATAKLHPALQAGREYACISVGDTGCGIPDPVLEHIFEPFFTTKTVGKGTGLGLSVVHGIIRLHGGEILVQTEAGRGTWVRVYLPRVRRTAAAPGDAGPPGLRQSRLRPAGEGLHRRHPTP